GARLAARRDRRAAGAGRARGDRTQEPRSLVAERRVLVGDRARHRGGAAEPRAGDVRLLAHRRLVGARPRAEAARRARPPERTLRRPRRAVVAGGVAGPKLRFVPGGNGLPRSRERGLGCAPGTGARPGPGTVTRLSRLCSD